MEIWSSNSFVQYEEIREYVTNYSLLAHVNYKAEFMLKTCFCFRKPLETIVNNREMNGN